MGLSEQISTFADQYERSARLQPALLVLSPILIIFELLYASQLRILTNILSVTAWCGGLYLLASLSREFGKRLEPKLFQKWGGKPSTQLLRHRDTTIEAPTKARYHSFLSHSINRSFPDPCGEASATREADEIYQSGVRWLLNQTRDTKKFALLFKENIGYGFKRNALGLKPLALMIGLGCSVWVVINQGFVNASSPPFIDTSAIRGFTSGAWLSLASTTVLAALWLFFFTEKTVRNQAFTYAETLLRACDELEQETLSKK